jgi:hypothetical protein
MVLRSIITCPNCGTAIAETMLIDACQFFYACNGSGARLKPKAGDCCVFCSYSDVPRLRFRSLARVARGQVAAQGSWS